MDEYITREEREQVLKDHPQGGQRNKGSDWRGRMERVEAGESLALYPRDDVHLHNLRVVAFQEAKKAGITVTTRKAIIRGELILFIWAI